jgi:hypothetical protein
MKARTGILTLGLLLFCLPVKAQLSDTFVFDKNQAITSWDGSDPANPPYPYAMGSVSLQTSFGGSYGSAIDVPFELGYLNNGFLAPCDPLVWQPKVWTTGDGTHDGDTFSQSGSTTCPYFTGEWGTYQNSNNRLDGFSVIADYRHTNFPYYYHGRKYNNFRDILEGGTGTVTDTIINQ